MTITDKTVGTATTAVNASVVPGTPSGLVDGDLMLICAAIRNNGVGTVNTPSGWTRVATNENTAILGRFFVTGDTMPTVTFTGGVANADTYTRALKVRGVGKDAITAVVADTAGNSSQQNINTAAVNVPGDNCLVLQFVWKQDDATSLSTPATFTADGLTNMTTGDDALAAIYTVIQTAETDISTGTITVTGGASAIARATTIAIKPAPTVSVTEQDVFPPRVLVTVAGLTPGDDVAVYRVVSGQRALVRAGEAQDVTDPAFLVLDAEVPFDVPVYYVAVVNSTAEYETAFDTYTLPGGKAVLSDAITGLSSSVVITAWDEKSYDRQSSVFKVGGRNVVVVSDLGQFEATIEVFFEAYSSTEEFTNLLRDATDGVLQLRRPSSAYDGVDCYVAVLSARERRYSQDGSDGRRMWTLDVAETDPWAAQIEAQGYTYADLDALYTGLTYADLAGDYPTYLALAQADLT